MAETSIRLTNVETRDVQFAFDKAFGGMRQRLRVPFRRIVSSPFQLNEAWRTRHHFNRLLLKKIASARRRIWVTNAYFVPNTFLLEKLEQASRRHVDVRILLPSKSRPFMMSIASAAFYALLLESGIAIHEYLPTMLHAKVLIIDDDWYVIGSTNLNSRSFQHDLEVNVMVETPGARKKIEQQFLQDLTQSRHLLQTDLKEQTLLKRLLARCILLLKYWL